MRRNRIYVLLAVATVALVGATVALAQVSENDLPQQQPADTDADRQALVAINLDSSDRNRRVATGLTDQPLPFSGSAATPKKLRPS
jgi:hypothetical protein